MWRRSASAACSRRLACPPISRRKLEDACKIAAQSEAFQRIVKQTLQPADYFQQTARASPRICAKDVEAKRRLLTALGMVK